MLPRTKGTTLMRRLYGTTIGRALSLLAALAMVAGAGFMVAGTSSASTNFGPGTVRGALVSIDANATRGEYLDANGIHHCLPEGPNSSWTWETGDYPAMAFVVTDPSCDFNGAGASKTTVTAPKPTTNPAGDVDPVLSLGSVGSQSVALSWSADNPPTDQTVKGYCVRYTRTIDTWATIAFSTCSGTLDSAKPTTTTALSTSAETRVDVGNTLHATLGGLLINTQYEVQVRDQYVSNSYGGWSNAVYPTTSATSTS